MKYDRILFTTHHLIGDCGNVTEYFASSARTFYLFSFCPTFLNEPHRLETYVNGQKTATHHYRSYRGKSVILKYVFTYLAFFHARLFRVDSGTEIICQHPLFCVGNTFFSLLKGGRTLFWVFDYFDQKDGLYPLYNRLADFYVRRLPVVYFLGAPMFRAYEKRLGKRPSARWEILTLGVKVEDHPRLPVPGQLGFIGNLKEGQGVEHVMDAMVADGSLRLDIVGVGVALEQYRSYAAEAGVADRVRFLGKIMASDHLDEIVSRWEAGVAMYARTSYTPYADPGKIKLYMELGLPILTTDVTPAAEELAATASGVVVAATGSAISEGLRRLRADYSGYQRNVTALARSYEFHAMYDRAFSFLALKGDHEKPTA